MAGLIHGQADTGTVAVKATSDGVLFSIDESSVPRAIAVPEISSTPTSFFRFGDGSTTIYYFRVTFNAGDDVVAGVRLSNGHPDTSVLLPNERLIVSSDFAITRVDVVAVGSAETTTPVSGEVVVEDTATSTSADYQSAMVTWTFDSADAVKTGILTASDRQSANVTIHLEGRTHA